MEVKFSANDVYNEYLNAYKLVKYVYNHDDNKVCLNCDKEALYYIPVNIGKDRKISVHGKCCSLKCIFDFLLHTNDVMYHHSYQIIYAHIIPFVLNIEDFDCFNA